MKYRVSLLPEQYRKRLDGKKKLERIKVYSLVALMILAMFLAVVVATNFYAEAKLKEVQKLDKEYAKEVAELEQFREINDTLQEKVRLIESIQVEEPQLVNFIAKVSNLKCPGITITALDCVDWKTIRTCTIAGTCDNREQYLKFEETLKKIEGITAVDCLKYSASPAEGALVEFTINVTCSGGVAVVTTEATTEATTDGENADKDVAEE